MLDVKTLIQKAEEIMQDNQLGAVTSVSYLVQTVEINGDIYELRVALTLPLPMTPHDVND